jgi:hypothetical protein
MPKLSYETAATLGVPPGRYQVLLDQIVAGQGRYIPIPLEDLGGDHPSIKQSRLLQAAKRRGLRITSTARAPGCLFARLLTAEEAR